MEAEPFNAKEAAARSLRLVSGGGKDAEIEKLERKLLELKKPFANPSPLPVQLTVPSAVLELMRKEHPEDADLATRLSEDLTGGFLKRLNVLRRNRGDEPLVTPEELFMDEVQVLAKMYALNHNITVDQALVEMVAELRTAVNVPENPLIAASFLRRGRKGRR